jgi:hypothetical protein
MTREEITELANPDTFQPFVIVTSSGHRFKIPHADFIDIPPVPEDEGEQAPRPPSYVTVYGKASIPRFIVLSNITAIEFQKEPTA